ncbi:hypothetical protein LSCM4_02693 [Leishmania orientalis]|uniref:Uncharacterized protein n=1 Tax=Leishmania orientalis TaxID=2249476 RepID=A0A836H3Z8_9TRYP|nr:hypothetical protein LSCM4_02693 [Leishmania orientalis]
MSIKAKPVDRKKTTAFDRGQFAVSAAAALVDLPKRSYYYEGRRRYTEADAARSGSSSSSVSSSRSPSLHTTGSQRCAAAPRSVDGSNERDRDMSDDEEVVRRARMATQALLGNSRPASRTLSSATGCAGCGLAASPNTRLERYLRERVPSTPSTRQSPQTTCGSTFNSCATAGGETSANAEDKLSQTENRHCHRSHNPAASTTVADASGAARDTAGTSVALSPAVEEALRWHTANSEFQHLMALLAEDVRREQRHDLPLASESVAAPAAETAHPQSLASSSTTETTPARTYAPPSRTFAALEESALEQLYEDWCLQRGEGDEAEGSAGCVLRDPDLSVPEVFIAADHRAAAFVLAASAAQQSASASLRHAAIGRGGVGTAVSSHPIFDAPFTWEELFRGEMTRRNTRHAPVYNTGSGALLSHPAALAEQATGRLQRFFQSVACVERLVCDRRFMRSVAMFLYEKHKVFLPHYRFIGTPSRASKAASVDDGGENTDAASTAHANGEHTHAEHQVYEEFGERVSAALLSVLTHHVPGFDEAEFVEALYDTPAADLTYDTEAALSDCPPLGCLQSVLSFPSWRLVLAMSDFESFFVWMMDYIHEEYHLDCESEEDAPSVAVTGVRGLRALIQSTYIHPGAVSEADISAADPRVRVGSPSSTKQEGTQLQTASQPVSDHASVSFAPRPGSEPQHLSPQRSPPLTRLSHTPPPPENAVLPARTSLLSKGRSSRVPPRKFFPTPPASIEGASRGVNGTGVPPYRRREATHPGRDLPPILPDANFPMPTCGSVTAASCELPSSTSRLAPSPQRRQSERDLEQVTLAGSLGASTLASDHVDLARSPVPHTATKVTSQFQGAPAGQGGAAAQSRSRLSTTHTSTGNTQKPKPQKPRLNR